MVNKTIKVLNVQIILHFPVNIRKEGYNRKREKALNLGVFTRELNYMGKIFFVVFSDRRLFLSPTLNAQFYLPNDKLLQIIKWSF